MRKFFKGMDISSLLQHLEHGMQIKDATGTIREPFDLLKEYHINSVRLRIWNEPSRFPESGGYCDLKDTLRFAKMLKEHELHFYLDFHYSDFWADPAQQRKPYAWKDLPFDELVTAVYDFTYEVLVALGDQGTLPDLVQVGNEIRSGMLFPEGAVPNYDNLAKLVNAGIQAIRDVSSKFGQDIEVMIHIDQGGRYFYLRDWFDAMFEEGMLPIDSIGISFYSFWHGTFLDVKHSMEALVNRYKLPVYVVETAHPWRICDTGHIGKSQMQMAGFTAGKEEQKLSLDLIMQIVASIPDQMGCGVYYWEPLCMPSAGQGSWAENMGMLDENGQILPGFAAYKNFDPSAPVRTDLEEYINSLYRIDESMLPPSGTNLIPNGDFSDNLTDWWVHPSSKEVEVSCKDGEVYVSSKQNFTFSLLKDVPVEKEGTYCFSVDYRGTNTTGVEIEIFVKTISFEEEKEYTLSIYPTDVDWITHRIDNLKLPVGTIQVGIRMNTPPVFGRMRNFSLVEI